MEKKEYFINYKKFALIYFLYPFLLVLVSYDKESTQGEIITIAAVGTVLAIIATHIFFHKVLRPSASIIVDSEGMHTYSMSMEKETIKWDNIIGPIETSLGVCKRYTFTNMDDEHDTIIFTSLTENTDDLLERARDKIAERNGQSG